MALSDTELKTLTEKARQIRKDIIQVVFWSGGGMPEAACHRSKFW